LGYHRVSRQQGDSFDHGLSDQDAVEGIFVYGRKGVDFDSMLAQDGQFLVPVIQHCAPQNPWVELKSLLSKRTLDCNVP
jgi:hypothetical protein